MDAKASPADKSDWSRFHHVQSRPLHFSRNRDFRYDVIAVIEPEITLGKDAGEVAEFWENVITDHINPGGHVVVMQRPRDSFHFPWFQLAHDKWNCGEFTPEEVMGQFEVVSSFPICICTFDF